MQADHFSIAFTMRWSCDDALVELVELPLQRVEHLARRRTTASVALLRAAAELGEVARVDRLGERRARVVAAKRAVVRGAVGGPRLVRIRSLGSDCGLPWPNSVLIP